MRAWSLCALPIVAALGAGCRDRAAPKPALEPAAASAPNATIAVRWQDDLRVLSIELPKRHPDLYFHQPEPAFRAAVAQLDADLPTLTPDQRRVRLSQLVAAIGDSHTRVVPQRGLRFPLNMAWFEDGLFVTGATGGDAWAVGHAVTAVGGRPVDEVLALAGTVVPHDNDSWLRGQTPAVLIQPPMATGLGLTDAAGTLTLTIAADDGPRPLVLSTGYGRLRGPKLPPDAEPLAWRGAGRVYWSEYLPESRALFVQYNQCRDAKPTFAAFVDELAAVITAKPVDRLVIDLRGNQGGNSQVMAPLVALLRDRPALATRTFVLIGRDTFSSAVMNALELEELGAILVGEIAGGAPSHHGEVRNLTLPSTGVVVSHSTKRFTNARHPGTELVPAIVTPLRAADFFAGRDAALAAALAAPLAAPSR